MQIKIKTHQFEHVDSVFDSSDQTMILRTKIKAFYRSGQIHLIDLRVVGI